MAEDINEKTINEAEEAQDEALEKEEEKSKTQKKRTIPKSTCQLVDRLETVA